MHICECRSLKRVKLFKEELDGCWNIMEVICVKSWVRELFIIVTIGMVNRVALVSCSRKLLLSDSTSYQ
jgi:hypothetical protein